MANTHLNRLIKRKQVRIAAGILLAIALLLTVIISLLTDGKSQKQPSKSRTDLTGIVDESFTTAASDNALTNQQVELDELKKEIGQLTQTIKTLSTAHEKELDELKTAVKAEFASLKEATAPPTPTQVPIQPLWHGTPPSTKPILMNNEIALMPHPKIHKVSFRPHRTPTTNTNRLNPAHYVPSNTSVRAVVLGGADADASVNGQSKNNGVMLFKFLEDGTLPNGKRSRLSGCRVSANSYGDISSERAIATLYRLSCAHAGEPIIDKTVTGWVFFKGKVGIKGQPLMRDNKVMQWAGISGALSGVAQAAQYAQSVQQFGAFGAASVVPSGSVAPYAAYGGAAKAADVLSQYYVKRAEQYHPVIQVGAGNIVTIVFKDGFYLEPEEGEHPVNVTPRAQTSAYQPQDSEPVSDNAAVPSYVLERIDSISPHPFNPGVEP